jgi:hypothetical protein
MLRLELAQHRRRRVRDRDAGDTLDPRRGHAAQKKPSFFGL